MKHRGFTLIEIIVSVTLLLLLSGLFIANYNGFNATQMVKQSALDVISNLQSARTMASAGVKPLLPIECNILTGYTVHFISSSSYSVQALCDTGLVGETRTYILSNGVVFSPVPDDITFYALGGGTSEDRTIFVVGNGVTLGVSVFKSGIISEYNGATPGPYPT